jgi:hypothetical protein
MQRGTIIAVEDHGTIISFVLDSGIVHGDHRMMRHILEAEGDVIGREVEYDETTVSFLD